MTDSREKGKRGEREWAQFCRDRGFLEVRRGVQYNGLEGEDCVNLPGVHQEVKREEQLNVDKALAQAVRDAAPGTVPIVAHRKNAERSQDRAARFYRGWKVTLRAEDFLALLRQLHQMQEWGDLVAEGIAAADTCPTDVGEWLSLRSLAMHYRDHLRRGDDHRWQNLAEGLMGGEQP